MSTPIQPDKYARAAGFDPYDFVEAVKAGEDEYSGIPIGEWRQQDMNGRGTYLAVPDDHARQLGFNPDSTSGGGKMDAAPVEVSRENPTPPNGIVAAAEAAPPVSANAGAAYTAGKFADTVKEQPQVMGDVVDGLALLGSAGLAYSTAEEGEVAKASLAAASLFGAFKGIRYLCEQGNRKTDMQERQQRHKIQQERTKQMEGEKGSQRRLNRQNPRRDHDGAVRGLGS